MSGYDAENTQEVDPFGYRLAGDKITITNCQR